MANSVMEQGEKYVHKRKRQKKWMIASACAAVVAVSGTIAALMLNGQALNHTKRVLDCKLEVHEHEKQCYSQVEGEENLLICGYADYVVHIHNDDCYAEDGQLVCRLPEIEPHEHTEECYEDQEFLICEQEEIPGHTHEEGCYEMRPVETAAQDPEGTGAEGEEGPEGAEPAPEGEPEAGGPVEEEPVLVCTQEEMEGHMHGDDCYETRRVLACGKLELHTHDEELCYEEVEDEAGNKYKNLICEEVVLYEHIHGEDCFEVVELTGEEVGELNEANKNQEPSEGEADPAEDEGAPEAGAADPAEDAEEPGEAQEPEEKQFQKVYEDEAIKVTASYNEDAGIPEEAELKVEPVTEETEPDPAEAEAVQALLGEKEPSAKMSYTIGFFVDGEEIEPTGVVTITVQLPDGQQVTPGAPVTVIHYGDNGPEAIQGSNVMEKDGKLSLSFDSSAFSKFMIVIGEPEEEPAGENPDGSDGENGENPDGEEEEPKTETVSYKLQDSFLYENDDFRLTLRVTGTATAEMPVEAKQGESSEVEDREDEVQGADEEVPKGTDMQEPDSNPQGSDVQEPDSTAANDDEVTNKPEEGQDAETGEAEMPKTDTDQTQDDSQDGQDAGTEDGQPEETEPERLNADDVKMDLQFLGQEDETYREIKEFAQNESVDGKLLELSVMRYSFTYKDVPLDISECEVRAEVALKEKAAQAAADTADEETEQKDTAGGSAETGENAAEEPVAGEAVSEEKGADGAPEAQTEGEIPAGEPMVGEGDSGEEPAIGEPESAIHSMLENDVAENEMLMVSLIQDNGTEYETADSKNLTEENNSALVMKAENLRNDTLAMSYTAGKGPAFTVQYYARLDRIQYGDNGALEIIDTSGSGNGEGVNLPQNGETPPVKKIILTDNEGIYTPATEKVLTKIFEVEEPYQFYISQNLENVDILYQSDNYTRKEIWVKEEGTDPESSDINGAGWLQFTDIENVKFVYNESVGSDLDTNTISIQEGTVLRLVYDPKENAYNNAAKFYDYDISDGYIYSTYTDAKNGTNKKETSRLTADVWYAKTLEQGINSNSNYPQDKSGTKLAFGNKYAGTGLGELTWNGNTLNMTNLNTGKGYKGCTFGIVSGLAGGKIQYSEGIIAPNLFNDGDADGKTTINNWSLNFDRVGDTYTLKSVEGAGSAAANLDHFFNPQRGTQDPFKDIFTNNFWPMDASLETFGTNGHDLKFGDYNLQYNRRYGETKWTGLPISDDGVDHNAYFGMQYAINFSYTDTYRGPLEYLFFGDDDMWVFLDGELICDIGGVHSSVGAYVNLWDCLTPADAGEHTLQVFYTERGASGSTCYMQFTLPSVSSAPLDTDTGLLSVEKRVDGPYEDGVEYGFKLSIDPKNNSVYPYTVSYAAGGVKRSGTIKRGDELHFSLGKDEKIVVDFLPVGTEYTVTEDSGSKYTTTVSVNGGSEQDKNEASGTIANSIDKVVYTNYTSLELPKTGSSGVIQYTFGGIAVTAAGLMYGYQWKRRRERRNQS